MSSYALTHYSPNGNSVTSDIRLSAIEAITRVSQDSSDRHCFRVKMTSGDQYYVHASTQGEAIAARQRLMKKAFAEDVRPNPITGLPHS